MIASSPMSERPYLVVATTSTTLRLVPILFINASTTPLHLIPRSSDERQAPATGQVLRFEGARVSDREGPRCSKPKGPTCMLGDIVSELHLTDTFFQLIFTK
jgi:hypothetical protein